jgi:hypothetical protein
MVASFSHKTFPEEEIESYDSPTFLCSSRSITPACGSDNSGGPSSEFGSSNSDNK